MTDWLEKLLDQAEEDIGAESGKESFDRDLLRGWSGETIPGDRQQAEAAQTTGQGEESTGERMENAAFGAEQALPGRTVPERGENDAIGRLNGVDRGAWGQMGSEQTDQLLQTELLRGRERRQAAAESLYRRLSRTGREPNGSHRSERTVVVEQQSVGTPSLTVDQLDRAVRRDSRRYDGGMELY